MSVEPIGAVVGLTVDIPVINAAPNPAENFDALILQLMLKSTCIDQHFVHEVSNQTLMDTGFVYPKEHMPSEFFSSCRLEEPSLQYFSNQDFINLIEPYAKEAAQLMGLDYKVLIAQAALETGWGKFVAKDSNGNSSHNLFNIKSSKGHPSVEVRTTEYMDGLPVKIKAE